MSQTQWVVRTQTKTQTYVPYDSLGMTSFIRKGLLEGDVFVNDVKVRKVQDFPGEECYEF